MTELLTIMAAKHSLKNIHRLIEAATTTVPHNESFVADLESVIERIDAKERRVPSKSYKPSSMVCVRNMYFQMIGEEQDIDRGSASLVGIGQSGSARHIALQDAINRMKEFGVDCEYIEVEDYVKEHNLTHLEIAGKLGMETKLRHKDLNLSFLCDGIIRYKGEYYILEIKTETSRKWNDRTGAAEEHYAQGTCYSICFGIDKVLYLYENRDLCLKKSYILEITDEMKYDLVISKIEAVDSYVNNLIPPPKPTDIPKKTCTYCKYKTPCKKAGA